jgi:hypothetical protein
MMPGDDGRSGLAGPAEWKRKRVLDMDTYAGSKQKNGKRREHRTSPAYSPRQALSCGSWEYQWKKGLPAGRAST